ncbi:MAG TPA: subclass B3 metallo-beta-lactamase [Vicinamibacterales bacterium]|nr:subclass B3 metallo-beta-lactamase [Vicinamibacterales bacterium]
MRTVFQRLLIVLTLLVSLTASQSSLLSQANDWLQPFPPFRIAGNLYYVGSRGLAAYLVTTSEGHILINSNLEESVPMLRASIEKLGFTYNDLKIVLISHAHFDHNAGSALIKKQTGATYMVMAEDVSAVESGGKTDFNYGNDKGTYYPRTTVDRTLHDKDEVKLGDAVLVAHLTAGHTKGCTTWTMKVRDGGTTYDAVIVCSPNVNPGYKLVNNAAYPGIADDYARMFRTLTSLPCDLFLGAHGSYFDLEAKYGRMQKGDASAFVDPAGYKTFIAAKTAEFQAALKKQRGQ